MKTHLRERGRVKIKARIAFGRKRKDRQSEKE